MIVTGDYSSLGLLIADNTQVKAKLDQLTDQIASGHVADSYGGLGAAAQVSLSLRPQLNSLAAEQTAINAVSGRLSVTQTALSQINAIASSFAAQTVSLNGLDPNAIDITAQSAKEALGQLAGLLNATNGSTYVFAGIDTSNPPVPDPSNILASGLYTQINAAVGGLSSTTDNAVAIEASTLALAQSDAAGTTPFSAGLGGVPTLQLGSGQQIQVGLLANANTLAISTGATTTGSYVRDLFRSLSTLASLSSTQVSYPGFKALVSDARATLQGVVSAVATETGALGNIQAALTVQSTQASDAATSLQKQLSGVEDVDAAQALTQLSLVQTQLQASYKLVATAKQLSLVQYL